MTHISVNRALITSKRENIMLHLKHWGRKREDMEEEGEPKKQTSKQVGSRSVQGRACLSSITNLRRYTKKTSCHERNMASSARTFEVICEKRLRVLALPHVENYSQFKSSSLTDSQTTPIIENLIHLARLIS